jgi:hypothetical protein
LCLSKHNFLSFTFICMIKLQTYIFHHRSGYNIYSLYCTVSYAHVTVTYSHHLKTGRSGMQMVIFQTQFVTNFQLIKSAILFLTIWKLDWLIDHLKTWQSCLVFRCHLNTGPFDFRTQINHLNTGQVRYSDGDCKVITEGITHL